MTTSTPGASTSQTLPAGCGVVAPSTPTNGRVKASAVAIPSIRPSAPGPAEQTAYSKRSSPPWESGKFVSQTLFATDEVTNPAPAPLIVPGYGGYGRKTLPS